LPYSTGHMFLLDGEIKGSARLSIVADLLFGKSTIAEFSVNAPTGAPVNPLALTSPDEILPRIRPNGHRRTLFFAGKGGVGKTVVSCTTAVWLARRGYRTLLLTTDPAAHLGDVLGTPIGDSVAPVGEIPNLWAAKIDPKVAASAYKARILADAEHRGRTPESIKVMAEELESPCTEEMAAFDRFIEYASQDGWDVVVFDTAPTGHTLRLLELPMEWSKQLDVKAFASVESQIADDLAKQRFGQVIDMMRDPERSTFAFVLYPESTPIEEAYRASEELKSLDIPTGLAVANFVIPAEQATTPFIRSRRAMQEKYLIEIAERFSAPLVQIPLLGHEIKGLGMLAELGEQVLGQTSTTRQTVKA
jgi:arsenite/tail-anchored protein-transporting ATPase